MLSTSFFLFGSSLQWLQALKPTELPLAADLPARVYQADNTVVDESIRAMIYYYYCRNNFTSIRCQAAG